MLKKYLAVLLFSFLTITADYNIVDCYNFLVDNLHANEILAENFYAHTYFLNMRPINSYPIYLNYHYDQICQDKTFNLFAFYNETLKMNFTKKSDVISSYLNIGPGQGFIPILEELREFILNLSGVDVPETIGLLVGATVQERRAGILMQFLKTHKNFTFEISTPIMYQESNFFLGDKEQKALLEQFDQRTQDGSTSFVREHLVADRLGIGDTRIKIGYQLVQNNRFCSTLGAQISLPTAFSFKKGLYGSSYRKKCMQQPDFALCSLIELFLDPDKIDYAKGGEIAKNFGFNAIDWLSAILLDDPLGNNKHFTLGCFLESKFQIAENIHLDSVASLEYIIPKQERRFFLTKKNKTLFANDMFPDLDPDDPDNIPIATELVNFLSKQAVETFFPPQYTATVAPGFMFQFTVSPKVIVRDWTFNVGYDFWFRQREHINPIYNVPIEGLKNSCAPKCSQSKLFAAVKFNKIRECFDWAISLSADQAISKSGIGRDFNFALGFQVNF